MAIRRQAAIALLAAVLLAACSGTGSPPRKARLYAFGTRVTITAYGLDGPGFDDAVADARRHLETWHGRWHPDRGDGIARLNRRLAAGDAATVPEDLRPLLSRAARLEHRSGGHFNAGLGALVRLWGFDEATDLPSRPPPAGDVTDLVHKRPSLSALSPGDGRLEAGHTAVRIDLGGFAKGVAAGRLRTLFRDAGADAVLVSAGGDIATAGTPGDRPWRIGIRAPRGEGLIARVTLRAGESIFTSGDYERFFEYDGRRYHHIIDPATGRPARGVRSVTVIADDPGLADAAATALFVAGPGDWVATARRLGIAAAMLVDGRGGVHLTDAMAKRIELQGDPVPDVVERVTP
ncbi:FAD:protein FMN transferase [wastewater metagenome]|uniref:FAD:protein FMN transferase n=2 Tax=unclassified sequences TaxID=12908 RepID=A0A5B8RJH9_9ZZZZ|nr:FAD:protein FMN transferase [Arhodomonas sp. KWT]QEA07017.1 FAD:protein FMN transferase [uncultured organism]